MEKGFNQFNKNTMEEKVKNGIENYQCPGCIIGGDISCFKRNANGGVGCGDHYAGTMISSIGKIFLGMPKGFNRLGQTVDLKPFIFNNFEDSEGSFNMWNVPVWKHLNKDGHTIVRGLRPRKNETFIYVYLENCMDKINCLEITQSDVDAMD